MATVNLYGAGSDSEGESATAPALDVYGDSKGIVTSNAIPTPSTQAASMQAASTSSDRAVLHVVVAEEDSESDQDVWFRKRAAQPAAARKVQAAKKSSPGKPAEHLGKAIADVAQAVVAAVVAAQSHSAQNQSPGSTQPSSVEATPPKRARASAATPGTPPPTALTGQSKGSGVQGAAAPYGEDEGGDAARDGEDGQKADGEAGGEDATKKKKTRAARGTAGTFAGRRPPKTPAKLALFNAKREAHMKAKEDAKKENLKPPTLRQRAYWEKLSSQMVGNGVLPQVPQKAMKRPAAATASKTPSPKKTKSTSNEETPEKVQEAGEQPAQPGADKVDDRAIAS